MIRTRLKNIVDDCFAAGVQENLWSDAAADKYTVEIPKHENQGDFSTNIALVVAGIEKRNPREIGALVVEQLKKHTDLIEAVDLAGPGFVNVTIQKAVWQQILEEIEHQADSFGQSEIGGKRRVMVEFVSANPTGPLSIGHGRQAILGDGIARLLEATGHHVYREYYYNDAGRQMRVLGESARARYLELLGRDYAFPEDGYQGEYIYDIGRKLIEEQGETLVDCESVEPFKEMAEKTIFEDISATLARMDIIFDNYYNERSLYEDGQVDAVVQELTEKGLVYEQDGATWFKTTELGQEKDRVIIKSSGEPTYRLPDIAYHREKFRRNFDWLIDIFGSDHIATIPDVKAGVEALGYDSGKITVVLHQFVTLMRDGKQVKMSTRKANFITVDELLDEVGVDAARFFFLMRKPDSQLEFDLDLATRESQENPVYYVQYAHARACSILRLAAEKGVELKAAEEADLSLLVEPEEIRLLKQMGSFPTLIQSCALELEPYRVLFYAMDLAGLFHSYYNKHKVIAEDEPLSRSRLCLVNGLRTVFGNVLKLVGLSAPEIM